jgi:hypothetical protein
MKLKAGDRVRIHTRRWIDAQEKDDNGAIVGLGRWNMTSSMQAHAGQVATIVPAGIDKYRLDIDDKLNVWEDWMFDPNYRPEDGQLSAEDALRAMLDGETLYSRKGHAYRFNKAGECIEYVDVNTGNVYVHNLFSWGLFRRQPKSTRTSTRWEILAWAGSEESRGWLVRYEDGENWHLPQYFSYSVDEGRCYQRARLLPDRPGIDEDTIQTFRLEQ